MIVVVLFTLCALILSVLFVLLSSVLSVLFSRLPFPEFLLLFSGLDERVFLSKKKNKKMDWIGFELDWIGRLDSNWID